MEPGEETILFFRSALLDWYAGAHRPMPWKGIRDPYLIWLSEVILQQTRVEQGWPYFERFREQYPRITDLAAAPEDEIMKLWEGLGYYSRARHLHQTAKRIAGELGGRFPDTYAAILALKGIGPYTAAAIASFAYDLPHAVVDGNVIRVLARFFGLDPPVDTGTGKALFSHLAQELLDPAQPGRYNQAMMDFGATLCTPRKPGCHRCPLQAQCRAFAQNRVNELPVKAKKIKKRIRYFHYFVIGWEDQVLVHKRTEKDIWRNLYQFPLLENRGLECDFETDEHLQQWVGPLAHRLEQVSPPFRQELTHQTIVAVFREIRLNRPPLTIPDPLLSVDRKNLTKFAFPKIIDWYLRDNSLYLKLH